MNSITQRIFVSSIAVSFLLRGHARATDIPTKQFHIAESYCKQGRLDEALKSLTESFEKGFPVPSDVFRFPDFQSLIRNDDARKKLNELLRAHARENSVRMVTTDEPGEPLIVNIIVHDPDGKPVPGAKVYVFHADDSGKYTPTSPTNEPNPRLFAYMKTEADGKIEFRTIRPGPYPERKDVTGDEKFVPRHIHFEVTAGGFADYKGQMIFDDDERVTEPWREWAKKLRNPIAHVTRDENRRRLVECQLILEQK